MNKKPDIAQLPIKIKELITTNNLSYEAFGLRIGGKSKGTISNWIKGNSFPDACDLLNICTAFNIEDIRELFGFNTSEFITIKRQDFEDAIKDARYQEAREIAIGKSISVKQQDSSGAGGRSRCGGKAQPSATAPPQ